MMLFLTNRGLADSIRDRVLSGAAGAGAGGVMARPSPVALLSFVMM